MSLNELVYSGAGAQRSDGKIHATGPSRPFWTLRPLPLQQVNPSAYGPWDESTGSWGVNRPRSARGPPQSLQSACLGVISQNLHTYDPTTLTGLPPQQVQRIMARALSDRRATKSAIGAPGKRPDDATLWVFIALADPTGAAQHAKSHTLALPPSNTLAHLPPSRERTGLTALHPLIAAPLLFKRLGGVENFAFLTTLQLDGVDDAVTDTSILSLRYATNLTCLWTRGSRTLSDHGIRMLSASLAPPEDGGEPEGLWRLRAWFLAGCRRVGDSALRSFAKWPGLVLLDLRDTSCTEHALGIFNRANAALWAAQPPFQACSDGLVDLFGPANADTVLANLAETLIAPDVPAPEDNRTLALHLVPGGQPDDALLPEPVRQPWSIRPSTALREAFGSAAGGVYRHGMGMVYGKNAFLVSDDTRARRQTLTLALELGAEDAHIAACIARGERPPERRYEREAREKEEMRALEKKHRTQEKRLATYEANRREWDPDYVAPLPKHMREEMEKKAPVFQDAAAQAEIAARRENKGQRGVVAGVGGDRRLMLVRMVAPEWEDMRVGPAAVVTELRAKRTGGADVANMLMSYVPHSQIASQVSSQVASSQPSMSSPPRMSSPSSMPASPDVKPTGAQLDIKPTASQLAASDIKPSASQLAASIQLDTKPTLSQVGKPSQKHFNPFRTQRGARTASGVTRLGEHICPEVETKPVIEPVRAATPLGKSASSVTPLGKSGVMPIGKSASGVTPLGKTASVGKSGVTPLGRSASGGKSEVTPGRSGVTPLGKSASLGKSVVTPLKSGVTSLGRSGVTPLGRTTSTPRPTPTSSQPKPNTQKPATAKPTPKAANANPPKSTQTTLSFFKRKSDEAGGPGAKRVK